MFVCCTFEFIWKPKTCLNSVLTQKTERGSQHFAQGFQGELPRAEEFLTSQQHSWDIDIGYQETKEMFCLTAVVTLLSITVQQLKSKSYAKFTKDSSDAFFPLVHVKKHQDQEGGYKCKNICFKNLFVKYPCKNKCEPSIYCIVDGSAIFLIYGVGGRVKLRNQRVWK